MIVRFPFGYHNAISEYFFGQTGIKNRFVQDGIG